MVSHNDKQRKHEIWFLFKHPINFFSMDTNLTCQLFNSSCGDDITVYVKIKDENITAMSFQGKGCSLLIASASLAISYFENTSKTSFLNAYNELCMQLDAGVFDDKFDLFANSAIYRKKCILLPWQAFYQAIDI